MLVLLCYLDILAVLDQFDLRDGLILVFLVKTEV